MTITATGLRTYRDGDDGLRSLEARLHGSLIRPESGQYDAARRVTNLAYDRHPAVIVRPADAFDVVRAVTFAEDRGLPIAVRAGGHSMAGYGTADDAVVIDLARLRGLDIDPGKRVARAGAGLTAGEYSMAAHTLGLATPFGDVSSVGIAGLTLGGGIGWLVRKHGLTIDDVLSVDLVTAAGERVTASAEENPDLFWAVRGGGGNFGIVTSFEYRLHEVGTVYGGGLFQAPTRDLLRGFGQVAAAAPDELTAILTVMHAPPVPFIPAERHGSLVAVTGLVFAGDVEAGARAVAPLRGLGTPIADLVRPMGYPDIYQLTAAGAEPHASAIRSTFLADVDDETVDVILDFMNRPGAPLAMAQLRALGGAMARVPAAATAFAHRQAPYLLSIIVPFVDAAAPEGELAWLASFWEALRTKRSGVYSNFLGDEGEARIHEAYPAATYERLSDIKRRYDPANVFRLNQNIAPAS